MRSRCPTTCRRDLARDLASAARARPGASLAAGTDRGDREARAQDTPTPFGACPILLHASVAGAAAPCEHGAMMKADPHRRRDRRRGHPLARGGSRLPAHACSQGAWSRKCSKLHAARRATRTHSPGSCMCSKATPSAGSATRCCARTSATISRLRSTFRRNCPRHADRGRRTSAPATTRPWASTARIRRHATGRRRRTTSSSMRQSASSSRSTRG